MDTTVEIVVLVCFLALAAVGIASSSRQDRASADWMAAAGIIGAIGWVCWIFLRPGGDSLSQFWDMIQEFIHAN